MGSAPRTPPHERGRRSRPAAGGRRPAGSAWASAADARRIGIVSRRSAHGPRDSDDALLRAVFDPHPAIPLPLARMAQRAKGRPARHPTASCPHRTSPEAAPGSRRRRLAQPGQPRIAFFLRLPAKAGQIAPRRWQRGGLLRCRNGNAESSKGLADVIFCRLRKSRVAAKNLGNY